MSSYPIRAKYATIKEDIYIVVKFNKGGGYGSFLKKNCKIFNGPYKYVSVPFKNKRLSGDILFEGELH